MPPPPAPPPAPPAAPPPPPVVAPVTLTQPNTVDLSGVVMRHIWQEYHWKAPTDKYRGKTDDDKRVAERLDDERTRIAKTHLNTSFCEHAIATVDVDVPDGQTLHMRWWLEDMGGQVVAEHPDYTQANYNASAAAARVTTGKYAWRWDGRRLASNGRRVFLGDEPCWSRIKVKNAAGREAPLGPLENAMLLVKGDPYKVFVRGEPKNDTELEAEMTGPGAGRWLNGDGNRLQGDCWIKIFRGQNNSPGHMVFLGHGAIEATSYHSTKKGAIATPHDREHKAWIRKATHGGVEFWICELIDITAPALGGHLISLDIDPALPSPNNPFCDTQPNRPYKDGVHGHNSFPELNNAFVIDGASVGCTTVRTLTTGTQANPAAKVGDVQNNQCKFGKWAGANPGGTSNTPWGPPLDGGSPGSFWNKQNKRDRVMDALVRDDYASPVIKPPALSASSNDHTGPADEPLHMQRTVQHAILGGFLEHEIPRSETVAADPFTGANASTPKVRYRVELVQGGTQTRYYQYHRLVMFGLTFTRNGNKGDFLCWIPRLVQRKWNGNWRNLQVKNATQYAWYLEERKYDGTIVKHGYIGNGPTGTNTYATLPDIAIGRYPRDAITLPTLGVGSAGSRVFSVFKYRVELVPTPAANVHHWEALPAAEDLFTPTDKRAQVSADTIVTVGTKQYLEATSELELYTVNGGDLPGSPGAPGIGNPGPGLGIG